MNVKQVYVLQQKCVTYYKQHKQQAQIQSGFQTNSS